MPLATRRNPGTYAASDGSRTLTMRDDQPREDDGAAGGSGAPGAGSSTTDAIGVLHLHGGPRPARRVMWTEETVDNEGAGRKKSKICCIYRKPRAFDESSSEEESSDEDSGPENGSSARPANSRRAHHHHHHLHQHGEGEACPADGMPTVAQLEDAPEPNAYERPAGKGKGKAT